MKLVGQPLIIQNTDGNSWMVTWENAVTSSTGETISFTVEVPRSAEISVIDVQRLAIKRAAEMLTVWPAD